MGRLRFATALHAVVLVLLLVGCGAATKTATSGGSTTTTSGGSTSTVAPSGSPALRLDASSMGSYDVKVGQLVQLTLSSPGMRWSRAMAMPSGLLAVDLAPSPPVNGSLAIWTATAPGTVSITAVGEAACSAGVACPQYARLFRVSLTIS
ncbi:MAG: hypothetical protein ACRDZ8_03285 [Acidimicrobiales bacterium]